MNVALIDIQSGNLHSVESALRAAGADNIVVTSDPDEVMAADHIVLPGVGAFGVCAANLRAIDGMIDALNLAVFGDRSRPFLGICVGMQLMARRGEENGIHEGLDWVPGTVVAMKPSPEIRIPHMGWNDVEPWGWPSIVEPGQAYFLHSYSYRDDHDPEAVSAVTDHGGRIVAAVHSGTALGVQFHPEKSQAYGINFLKRFLEWMP